MTHFEWLSVEKHAFCPHNHVVASTSRGIFPKLSSPYMCLRCVTCFQAPDGPYAAKRGYDELMMRVMITHRTDICTGKASHEQLALPDGGRITFGTEHVAYLQKERVVGPQILLFSIFLFVSLSPSKAASFIYNLFVLAVVCQCFFLRHFLPSAHLDQWFFS